MKSGPMRIRRLAAVALLVGLVVWLAIPGEAILGISNSMFVPLVYRQPTPTPDPGWLVQYYANRELAGTPAHSEYKMVSHPEDNWGTGAPAAGVDDDDFSVRYTRTVYFTASTYRFVLTVDDGGRLYIDGAAVIDEWHGSQRGTASYVYDAVFATPGYHEIRAEVYDYAGEARVRAFWFDKIAYPEWKAEYYNNESLSGDPVLVRNQSTISADWGTGTPDSAVNSDGWSARFTRALYLEDNGVYIFYLTADDGGEVFIDKWAPGEGSILGWDSHSGQTLTSREILTPGWYYITVTYREATGSARLNYQSLFGGPNDGLKVFYYNNETLSGTPYLVRDEGFDTLSPDKVINRNWSTNAPVSGMNSDYWSAAWYHNFEADAGTYTFTARADDGVRIWVDGNLIIDKWFGEAGTTFNADIELYGDYHVVHIENHDITLGAYLYTTWRRK